jgi:biofilm PGA synthesis lipoprotein PgaB
MRFFPLLLALLLLPISVAAAGSEEKLTVLSYHEISNNTDSLVPQYSVTPTNFVRQLDWLRNNDYHFVSLDDVLADQTGKRPLPDKAVLITFDDGYHSVYVHAFPILKMFHIPAVMALVGSWLEEKGTVNFAGEKIPRNRLLSQAEIREMSDSGLVEMASHTYGLHEGLIGNPQGNTEPAATTRLYLQSTKSYETDAAYKSRIYTDLKRNNDLIFRYTGKYPRAVAWPYGNYNQSTRDIADKLGMKIGLTLDDGANMDSTPLSGLRRILVERNMSLWDLKHEMTIRNQNLTDNDRPQKIMHIDLDYIYDPDPAQQEKNLGTLLDRIQVMGVNTVYLQAFSDPDANGSADAVYFPNRHLPMRADLFNRVAWQIRTRTQVTRIYAWMPMIAWELPAKDPAANDKLVTLPSEKSDHINMGYARLSPFSERARQVIREIFQDLGRSTTLDGLLFHDDVTLSDYEDSSSFALKAYKSWGLPGSVKEIRENDDLLGRWTILKINYLDDFANELANIVRQDQPELKTARNLYSRVVMDPKSEVWYAQSLDNSLAHYDFTAIEAMPYMEGADEPMAWLHELVEKVKSKPGAMHKVVFELQTVDWRQGDKPIPSQELANTIRSLYTWGAEHVAYYPDNMFKNNPDPVLIKPVLDSKPNAPELH